MEPERSGSDGCAGGALTRRGVLAAGGGTLAALAGCVGDDGSADAADGAGVRLTDLEVVSFGDSPEEIHIIVELDGEIEHWETHESAPSDGTGSSREPIPLELPAEPGTVTVRVQVDGRQVEATGPRLADGGGCLRAMIVHDPDAEEPLAVYWGETGCPGGPGDD